MNQRRRVGISSLMSPPSSSSSSTRGLGLGLQQQHQYRSTTDENYLDLFSRNPRIFNSYSSDESDSSSSQAAAAAAAAAVSMKLGRLSVNSMKLSRSGIDDLFDNSNSNHDDAEAGKHDYDWLLTPPGTPLVSSSDANQSQSAAAGPRRTASVRSVSTTKSSRLSVAQSDNNYSSRPTRSSSVTRPSIATTNYTSFSANKSSTSILNTSSQSVTSISRPSTPSSRPSLPPSARPSTPTSRPSTPGARTSRPSTPSRSRSITTTTSVAKPQTPQSSRPSTPTSRTQVSTNSNSLAARSTSRPSTPTRRNPAPGPPQVRGRSASVGPPLTNSRSSSVASRGSSPAPRNRSIQPIVPPGFPLDTPPNLRTTMPDRPVSAGRSRPGTGLAASRKKEALGPVNPPRRQSPSPVTTRGRLSEPITKGRSQVNGHHHVNAVDNQKMSPNSEAATRRPLKPATSTDSTGFGRTISKKSIDMALRHMDIRNGSTGGGRSLSGISVFPQSVRSGMPKSGVGLQRGSRVLDSYPPRATSGNNVRTPGHSNTPSMSDNGSISCLDRSQDRETEEVDSRFTGKLCEPDIYDSSRYDMLLLKEDLKNTNWLQTMDDKSDLFDQPFEPLPEPFDSL